MNSGLAFQRLTLLTGVNAAEALWRARVSVFGLGGVGSWCAEALVRSGLGNITLIDFDRIDITNINRQVEATDCTIGRLKTEALAERIKTISPDCAVTLISDFFSSQDEDLKKSAEDFGIPEADYIVDAIDRIGSKLDLIEAAAGYKVTLYSSMGMARKLDPLRLRTGDIWETRGCPLARNVREGLRKRGFTGNFTAVYSEEQMPLQNKTAIYPDENGSPETGGKIINGSAITVTATAGMILASLVIRDICGRRYE